MIAPDTGRGCKDRITALRISTDASARHSTPFIERRVLASADSGPHADLPLYELSIAKAVLEKRINGIPQRITEGFFAHVKTAAPRTASKYRYLLKRPAGQAYAYDERISLLRT